MRNFALLYIKDCGSLHIMTFALWQVNTGIVCKSIVRVKVEAMESYAWMEE